MTQIPLSDLKRLDSLRLSDKLERIQDTDLLREDLKIRHILDLMRGTKRRYPGESLYGPKLFVGLKLPINPVDKVRKFSKCGSPLEDDDSDISEEEKEEDDGCIRDREETQKSVDGVAANCEYQGYRGSDGEYESSKLYRLDKKTTDAWSRFMDQCEMADEIAGLREGYGMDIRNGDGDGSQKSRSLNRKPLEEDKKCRSAQLKILGLSVLDILTILWVSMLILIGHFGSVTLWALLDGVHPEYLSPILDGVITNLRIALEETTSFLRSCSDYVTVNNTHYLHIKTFKLA